MRKDDWLHWNFRKTFCYDFEPGTYHMTYAPKVKMISSIFQSICSQQQQRHPNKDNSQRKSPFPSKTSRTVRLLKSRRGSGIQYPCNPPKKQKTLEEKKREVPKRGTSQQNNIHRRTGNDTSTSSTTTSTTNTMQIDCTNTNRHHSHRRRHHWSCNTHSKETNKINTKNIKKTLSSQHTNQFF